MAVDLVVVHFGPVRAVDGQFHEVGTQPMELGVRIGEDPGSQHFVRRKLNARNDATRRKCLKSDENGKIQIPISKNGSKNSPNFSTN